MSNGPFSPSTQFVPQDPDAPVYDSLTDLLSEGYPETLVVQVWPDSEPPVTLRRTIADLRHRYDQWSVKQVIDKLDSVTFRANELTLEWGWRVRTESKWVNTGTEEHARQVVESAPNLFELVVRHVTAWSTDGTE